MYRALYQQVKSIVFHFLRRVGNTSEARVIAHNVLKDLLSWQPHLIAEIEYISPSSYPELGQAKSEERPSSLRDDIVIIVARFRSGSTLLWNIFRHLDGCTAYFEPFHPLRPFDPSSRAQRVSSGHKHVMDYWSEYDGIRGLEAYFDEDWSRHQLLMSHDSWNPDMKRYIEILIEGAPQRPVLQFNRLDFRLPWIRHHFPGAKVIHLYRHPRDQWCSFIRDRHNVPDNSDIERFRLHDYYFLQEWVEDLQYHFPFLDWNTVSHPYEIFYYIWKLSYLFGQHYAHHSISFEDLVSSPRLCLGEIFADLRINGNEFEKIEAIISPPRLQAWKAYADDTWFRWHEEQCERVLEDFWRHIQT